MTNMLQDGATWIAEQLANHTSRAVTLQQGTTTLRDITATLALHEYEVLNADDFMSKALFSDWIFTATDLGTLEPRDGDVITDVQTGDRYRAVPVGTKPSCENNDSSGITKRYHTLRIE